VVSRLNAVTATLVGVSSIALTFVQARAQSADEPSVTILPTADAGAPVSRSDEEPSVLSEAPRPPAPAKSEPNVPEVATPQPHLSQFSSLPTAHSRRSIRAERFIGVAFTGGLLVLPDATPLPLPEVGLEVGINVGSYLMINVGAGFLQAAAGAKLFLGRGEVAPYFVARLGYSPWDDGPFVSSGLGVDVSRSDGTYAFAEVTPMLARSSLSDTVPEHNWRTINVQATFGYGKRF
jgi:hypothetical protein